MKFLLDTHVFLWWMLNDRRLSPAVVNSISDQSNEVFLSSISGVEMAIKTAAGKLKLPTSVKELISNGLAQAAMRELPLTLAHTYALTQLPLLHRDPFDRLLLAQAKSEGMTLVTLDSKFAAYDVPLLH